MRNPLFLYLQYDINYHQQHAEQRQQETKDTLCLSGVSIKNEPHRRKSVNLDMTMTIGSKNV